MLRHELYSHDNDSWVGTSFRDPGLGKLGRADTLLRRQEWPSLLKLETEVCEDFTIKEKAPTGPV